MAVPQRILWAIDLLDVSGSERLLEIGCGNGVAASLVCGSLTSGRLTAIDRSAKAIAAARQRNAAHAAAGKAVFVESSLETFQADAGAFDQVFAINVNVFWVDPDRALPAVARMLAPGARLFLFYEPPSAGQRAKAARLAAAGLERHDFTIDALVEQELAGAQLLAITARRG